MERFLLDTHALLWTLTEPRKLSKRARAALEDAQNEVFVSPVSVWEIAVKRALGKLQAPDNLEASIKEQGFTPLSLTFFHAEQAGALPPHHGDPFDRMLVAQAQAEGLILVTRDARIPLYGVRTMAA
ncbi:MAG: type II toxin-antitoxin system VapC family toxin [Desulfurellaceae bacterium]|nr:type II toxin-antitoxin system VapC family toxin [Desulfurellaceae bacterium]